MKNNNNKMVLGGAFKIMPQSPKTTGQFMQATTPTIKSEIDAKQCLSANSTPNNINNNNNTIFNFPTVQSAVVSMATTTKATDSAYAGDHTSVGSNSIFNSPRLSHHEGKKDLDVNDVNVNVNVVASSSNHAKLSTSCCPSSSSSLSSSSSSDPSNYNNANDNDINTSTTNVNNAVVTNTQSSNLNVISVCDGSFENAHNNGIIIAAETHDAASYYDAIKLEENGGATAIIYETIVIENPTSATSSASANAGHQEIVLSTNHNNHNNNNKYITNKNHIAIDANVAATTSGGGIIVLTGSLNDLLLGQNGDLITTSTSSQQQHLQTHANNVNGGTNNNIKCLNDVVKNQIQSIVLNLNSQSSASATTSVTPGQVTIGVNHPSTPQHHQQQQQQSIMLAINTTQQVRTRDYVGNFIFNFVSITGRLYHVISKSLDGGITSSNDEATTQSSTNNSVCNFKYQIHT
jgi:hypothetical protein